MKKVLLLIISLLIAPMAFAYQTVLVDFPPNQGWHADYYDSQSTEAILQYVPASQSSESWKQTVIFHSYKYYKEGAGVLIDKLTGQMEAQNPSQQYKYLKYSGTDAMATRCVQKNARIGTQCEIFRVTQSFEGFITMHYINKDVQDFKSSYAMWYDIISNVRIYYSYYMDDSILNKATSFQL